MKTSLLPAIILTLTLALMATEITPAQAALTPDDKASINEVKRETGELMNAVKSYSAAQRDQAIQEIEIAIIRLDSRIDALQARIDNRWDDMTQPAREQSRASIRAMQKQRVKLAEWYGNLKGSSSSAWDDIKRGFSKAYVDINKAWEKALKDFGSDKNQAVE
jgi:hypothetical protein